MLIRAAALQREINDAVYKCLNLEKTLQKNTDTSRVNREHVKFKLEKFMPDRFKCLIFTQRLTVEKDAEVRKEFSLSWNRTQLSLHKCQKSVKI